MSQHQITVERPWANIPTKQLINTETGQTEVFVRNPPFSDIKVAQSGANNQWEITDKNALLTNYKNYNSKNSTNITEQELNKKFFTDGTKQFNNDRAAVINKNSPENTKTFLATKQNPVPGTIDPKTGIKAGQTSPTTANQATNPGTGAVPADPAALNTALKSSGNTRNQFPTLKYPEKLDAGKQDVIQFSMLKYSPKAFDLTKINISGFGERKQDRKAIGVVTLPIPNGIIDSNAVTWGGDSMNAGEAVLANVALTTIKQGFSAGAGVIANAAPAAGTNDVKTGFAEAFAAAAIGGEGAKLLSRTEGAILNPNLELLFEAPTLRPFTFTFKLASRSEEESKIIRSIIRFFKQGSAAQKSESNLFLKSPHTFQIEYLHKGKSHTYLNKFKECALQSFGVSYTPEGQYATFNDGAMVSYQITMQFQELEPIFNEDYTSLDQNKDTDIGY